MTADVAAAADFYGKVFGWTFETYGGKDDRDTYTLVLADGLPIGGMVFDKRAIQGTTPSARWVGFISVTDVKGAAEAVTKGGGKVVFAPIMLGERGETAIFEDQEGAVFGVVNSKNGDPADYVADVNEWVWIDLWTGDVEKAARFYREVVGYETVPAATVGPRNGQVLLTSGIARGGIIEQELGASVETAGLAFAAFSATMAVMRFSGDLIRDRLGAVLTLRLSTVVAGSGLLLASLAGSVPLAAAGFALAGLGIANMVPIAFSAAGNLPGLAPGVGISAVSFMGYSGCSSRRR